jgi:hypothetical protein
MLLAIARRHMLASSGVKEQIKSLCLTVSGSNDVEVCFVATLDATGKAELVTLFIELLNPFSSNSDVKSVV